MRTLPRQFASNVHSLNHARNWGTANGLVDGSDAMSVLSVLTLIHTVNKAVKRHPKESNWTRMKKHVIVRIPSGRP